MLLIEIVAFRHEVMDVLAKQKRMIEEARFLKIIYVNM